MPLEEALQKARMVYAEDKRAWTSRSVILKHLGFTDENSGPANRTLSALRQYGLVEEKEGQLRVSDRAFSILALSDSSPEKVKRLRESALCPKIFKELWTTYGPELASDETMADFLIHKKEFNPTSTQELVSNFRKTISFAKLLGDGGIVENNEETGEDHDFQGDDPLPHPSQEKGAKLMTPLSVQNQAGRTPVGSEIPVASDCIMGVSAVGHVTQSGIDKLIAYLQLIKGSFPQNGNT
jgi:hypothetical protein